MVFAQLTYRESLRDIEAGLSAVGPKRLQEALGGGIIFRWVKMHLRIKAFHGTSENAVKTQILIAISV